jgi:hypothetical protein
MATSDDWYTPPEIFETLGLHFDLDVCAPKGGLDWIPATKHYSIEDDALTQKWEGRVWMNPPFSGPAKFVGKWLEHGNGCALIPLSKSRWFGSLWASSASIVVPDNPAVRFIREGVRKQIFLAMGFAAIGPQENHDAIAKLGRLR